MSRVFLAGDVRLRRADAEHREPPGRLANETTRRYHEIPREEHAKAGDQLSVHDPLGLVHGSALWLRGERRPGVRAVSAVDGGNPDQGEPVAERGRGALPYFRIAASKRSCGRAYTRRSSAPVIVSATSIALRIASSVAWTVA